MQEISLFISEYSGLNNLDRLKSGLDIFCAAYDYDPYIICSNETQNMIPEYAEEKYEVCKTYEGENSKIGMFKGYKVLTDNTLSFGEIKIR